MTKETPLRTPVPKLLMKIQCDSTGTKILVYDKTRRKVFEEIDNPDHVAVLRRNLRLEPLGKVYAKGFIDDKGVLHFNKIITTPQSW